MPEKQKIAVIIFNLGGPDNVESIKPFLMNFFTDPNIIRLPNPFRYFVARLIAARRSKREAKESYDFLGGRSPLLENTQAQADALEKSLNAANKDTAYKVFVCMRYWHPMAAEVAVKVKNYAPDKITLLPLYPQYSTTTTRSSLQQWHKEACKIDLDTDTSTICCYPVQGGFINASTRLIKKTYEKILKKKSENPPRILFSAHSLPEDIIQDGDPYQAQCEQTAQAIAENLAIEDLDWQICYQSRVGLKKWIGPTTEDMVKKAGSDNVPIIIYPHSFTQEHVETLVELDIEYREIAKRYNVPYYEVVKTVGVDKVFIAGLVDIVVKAHNDKEETIIAAPQNHQCLPSFKQCCKKERIG